MMKKVLVVLMLAQSMVFSQVQVRGGELFSKTQQLYGRYEVRMKTASGSGILSTFFTFENDGWMPDSENPWREIDIEVLGRYTDRFQTNIITGTAEQRITSEYYPPLEVDPSQDYHTYAIEWTPDYIAFLFDGEEVRRTEADDDENQIKDCRDIPQSYRFNMWANDISDWVGEFDPSILPRYQYVNWIRYYSYDIETGEFSLAWEDDFESFDSQRWDKGTHTIEDFTQFDPDNVVIQDGTLVLALTDMDGNGLENITVPQDEASTGAIKVNRTGMMDGSVVKYESGKLSALFELNSPGIVGLQLVDLSGRVIAKMKRDFSVSGSHQLHISDLDHIRSGTYMAKLSIGGSTAVSKVISCE
ncbi:MAG: family 16 glycosylhydrolase [Chitinispirillaceae bacterium]